MKRSGTGSPGPVPAGTGFRKPFTYYLLPTLPGVTRFLVFFVKPGIEEERNRVEVGKKSGQPPGRGKVTEAWRLRGRVDRD